MDTRVRGHGRVRSSSPHGTARLGRQGLPEASSIAADRAGNIAIAELEIPQIEALFRSELRRCTQGRGDGERAAAARVVWRCFRDVLRKLESARAGAQEASGAFARLNHLLEEDRRRLAHELHDESGQLLASVHISLGALASETGPGMRERLRSIRVQLDRVQDQLRRISHELRPTILEDLGLVPALRFLADGISARSGLDISVQGSTGGRLPPTIEVTLYRVVQEALNNSAKHAHASRVLVRLFRGRKAISCSIRDDGVGLDETLLRTHKSYNSLGLLGIRVRVAALNGSIRIDSRPGTGTLLKVSIPLEGNDDATSASG